MTEAATIAAEAGPSWVGICALIVAAAGLLSSWVWRIKGDLASQQHDLTRRLEAGNERFRGQDAALAEFRLQVSKEYASTASLREVEMRITDGFKDLKSDLKQGLDALAHQLANCRNCDDKR